MKWIWIISIVIVVLLFLINFKLLFPKEPKNLDLCLPYINHNNQIIRPCGDISIDEIHKSQAWWIKCVHENNCNEMYFKEIVELHQLCDADEICRKLFIPKKIKI